MNLNEYIQNINKEKCNDCKFNTNEELKSRPIIIIPPPNKPQIMLISRDPTINFLSIYKDSECYNSDKRRRILFAAAIPLDLIVRITRFLLRENINDLFKENYNLKEDINDPFKIIFEVISEVTYWTYWTHLHKCPTDEKNEFAEECADKWLKEEINKAKEDGIKAIICLGKDVEKWVDENEKLFRWDNIPGNDNERLIEFLTQKFGVDWVKIAKIKKIDDGRTIRLIDENNFLSLKLNNEKTKVILEINDSKTYEFIAKIKNGKLNIYIESKNIEIICLLHPSCANNRKWYTKNTDEKRNIEENIIKLIKILKICQRIRFRHQNNIS